MAVRFVDTTFRDGNQCLWATRLRTRDILALVGELDGQGYDAIELMGLVHFDAPVRYLKEDPWERIRLVREKVETPLSTLLRSRCLLGFDSLPDDINHLWVERLVANGLSKIVAFDGLHDWDNIESNLKVAASLGATTGAWLTYSLSPVHTDEFYEEKARELLTRVPELDVVVIEDASGVLTPDRIKTLVPAVRRAIGDRTLELHSHCMTGQAALVYLEAAAQNVEVLYTSIPPLADGAAPPSIVQTTNNLRQKGIEFQLDLDHVAVVTEGLNEVMEREGFEPGRPLAYDLFHYEHQMAGGVISNLRQQLRAAGIENRFEEVLHETARVRKDLGWPIVVTPFAQLMVTQSVLNVMQKERYSVVADEIKKYALGHYGATPAPVDPDVLDRIVANGSSHIKPERPELQPVVPRLRRMYPGASDDERLLRFVLRGSHVDEMLAAKNEAQGLEVRGSSLIQVLEAVCRRTDISSFSWRNDTVSVDLRGLR